MNIEGYDTWKGWYEGYFGLPTVPEAALTGVYRVRPDPLLLCQPDFALEYLP